MKKIFITLIIVVVLGALVFSQNKEDSDLRIGAVLSLTGFAAVDGENIKSGIEFARANLAKKGINLEVIYEDDATQPAKTVGAINKLSGIDSVSAIIGPTWSFLASAASETISQKGIVAFNPANTSEFVEGGEGYHVFGAPKNALKEKYATQWLQENGAKKIAIVLEQGTWGDSHILPFKNAVENVGGEVVFFEMIPFESDGQDIQTMVSKVKNEGADAVLFTGFDTSTALFINKTKDINPGLAILVATEIARKQNEEGIINVDPEDNVFVIAPRASSKFREDYKKEYGEFPGAYADRSYDGTMLLAEALLNKSDDQKLIDYIKNNTYEGYLGKYSFDKKGDLIGGDWEVEQLK